MGPPLPDLATVIEDLRVHQVELEMQNTQLQLARLVAEEDQARYFRHFDLAPVGMVRLSQTGMVLEANFLGAAMLEVSRERLASGRASFAAHVARSSQQTFHAHVREVLASPHMQSCEIRLRDRGGAETFVRMQSLRNPGAEASMDLLVTLTDLSELKRAEEAVHRANQDLEERVRSRTAQLGRAYSELETSYLQQQRLENEILGVSEREQRRFGQDLHDDLCQQLAGIALLGGVLAASLEKSGRAGDAAQAAQIAQSLRDAIACARGVARGLHPVDMDVLGLAKALGELAANTSGRVHCRFESAAQVVLDDHSVALGLYRIAQEAVTNALKHSECTHIVITLEDRPPNLILTVRDDGVGLPAHPPRPSSMGRHIMAYRAAAIGAVVTVANHPEGGVQVHCVLPVRRA